MADDDESLDEILSGKPETAPETTTEVQPEAQPRDDHGRYAPKGEEQPEVVAEQQPVDEPQPEPEHTAPVAAVVAERRKAQAANERAENLERDLAELRGQMSVLMQRGNQPAQPQPAPEPVKPPDFWESPDKYVEHALTPVQQQLAEMRVLTSRANAIAEHGRDAVTAAETALKEAVKSGQLDGKAVSANLLKSRDPAGDILRWHQSSPAVQEASMRDKLRAEIMAELGIDPSKPADPSTVAPSTKAPVVKLPPSLNRIPAGHSAPERDESLDEVLSQPRRRA